MGINKNSGKSQVASPIRNGHYFREIELVDGKYGSQIEITLGVVRDGEEKKKMLWYKVPAEDAKEGAINAYVATVDSIAKSFVGEDVFTQARNAYFDANPAVSNSAYTEWIINTIKSVSDWNSAEFEFLYIYNDSGKDDVSGLVKFKTTKDKDGNNTIYQDIPNSVYSTGTFVRRVGDVTREMKLSKKAQENVVNKDKWLEHINNTQAAEQSGGDSWG